MTAGGELALRLKEIVGLETWSVPPLSRPLTGAEIGMVKLHPEFVTEVKVRATEVGNWPSLLAEDSFRVTETVPEAGPARVPE